jgi:hypothetical protein
MHALTRHIVLCGNRHTDAGAGFTAARLQKPRTSETYTWPCTCPKAAAAAATTTAAARQVSDGAVEWSFLPAAVILGHDR